MHHLLEDDLLHLPELLEQTRTIAQTYLDSLPERPVAVNPTPAPLVNLPEAGIGGQAALQQFWQTHQAELGASAGPRFLGFVTGGTTPAALAADWLVSSIDQNLSNSGYTVATRIEHQTLRYLRQLLGLPDIFSGAFVTGATQANVVGLAQARQWACAPIDPTQEGMYGLAPIPVLVGSAHSSIYKSLSILGMGRNWVEAVPQLPGREAVDIDALDYALRRLNGRPAIVVASSGTVNTGDFDDIAAIHELKSRYPFWLHVDAAFGGFTALLSDGAERLAGWALADSITIDMHKWLNVPYDSAVTLTRHRGLQAKVFQNQAAYLGDLGPEPDFVHLTPENSRRFRALPVYLSLLAYGRDGIADIVARNCAQARTLGAWIESSEHYRLLAPVRLNIVCATLAGSPPAADVKVLLARLRDSGEVFLTPTQYAGAPGFRAAFSNWRTTDADVQRVCRALAAAVKP